MNDHIHRWRFALRSALSRRVASLIGLGLIVALAACDDPVDEVVIDGSPCRFFGASTVPERGFVALNDSILFSVTWDRRCSYVPPFSWSIVDPGLGVFEPRSDTSAMFKPLATGRSIVLVKDATGDRFLQAYVEVLPPDSTS